MFGTQFEKYSSHDQTNTDYWWNTHSCLVTFPPTVQAFPCCQDSHMTRLGETWLYYIYLYQLDLQNTVVYTKSGFILTSSKSTFYTTLSHLLLLAAGGTRNGELFC